MFLRGAGGFSLAVPFMPSLVPAGARAAAARPPIRFAMMLSLFGRDRTRWSPALGDAQLTQNMGVYTAKLTDIGGPISYILGPAFDPVRRKITIVQGLDELAPNGMHNCSLPTTGSARAPSGATGFGYSIDCVLEESTRFYSTRPAAGVLRTVPGDAGAIWGDFSSYSFTSRSRRGQHLQAEWSPKNIYDRYFNVASLQRIEARNARITAVTSRVYESYRQTIGGRRIGADDRRRLDHYMSLMSQVDAALAVKPVACARAADPGTPPAGVEAVHAAMMDMEVAALACGITKVVMHAITQGSSDAKADLHGPAHEGPGPRNGEGLPPSKAANHNVWQMTRVAELLRKLDAITEADGSTLLDNTLFIYSSEDGSGAHEHVDLPVIVAGGQGKIRTGYYMDFRPRPFYKGNFRAPLGRPYNQLLVTAFKALGLAEADYQKFGQRGFGPYDVLPVANAAHYAPSLARPDDPLPFLYAG
jgi:hypothetical protein